MAGPFLLDKRGGVGYAENMMFKGLRVYSSDSFWQQIFLDLGAEVADCAQNADVNIDLICPERAISVAELKTLVFDAVAMPAVIRKIFGRDVVLPRLQAQVVAKLYTSGGMTGGALKSALGYAGETAAHAVDTAIYQLRRTYGHDFIVNNHGVYAIGHL